jgi:hypothetical protein
MLPRLLPMLGSFVLVLILHLPQNLCSRGSFL